MKVSSLLWIAVGVELAHLLVVLVTPEAVPLAGGVLPGPGQFLRAVLACLVIPAAGLPLALLLLVPRAAGGKPATVGAFSLAALAFGCALVLFFVVAVVIRFFLPLTAYQLTLIALAVGAGGLLAAGRFDGVVVELERGLSRWPLVLALVLTVGFAVVARVRLFGGPRRFVPISQQSADLLGEQRPSRLPPEFLSGVRRSRVPQRYLATGRRAVFATLVKEKRPVATRFVFVITAPPGAQTQLWQVSGEACGEPSADREARQLAGAAVPEQVLGFPVAPVAPRFNALLVARVESRPGLNCYELRFDAPPGAAVELTDLSREDLGTRSLLDDWVLLFTESEVECHISDLQYHLELRRSNQINPFLLLWGCFAQVVGEVLAGGQYPLLGVLFLMLCLLSFAGASVMVGAVSAERRTGPERSWLPSLLLLGPYLCTLYALTWAHVHSFPFPDTVYSFLLVAALALLLLRNRVGFILLGCLAAYARYPGAYVLALGLVAYLVFFADDRPWAKRTLLWSVLAGLAVVVLLLIYFGSTIGLDTLVKGVYFEVFPEHFQVHATPSPVWQRVAIFFAKLALLSSLTILLWPLGWRSRAARLLATVAIGYALPLMAVHVPHSHYYPVLVFCTAAAGLGGAALSSRRHLLWTAAILVAVGTALGLQLESFDLFQG